MSKKKKKQSDTREFTALKPVKQSDCKSKQPSDCMVFTDREQKPSFEV